MGCAFTHHYVVRGDKTIRYYACLHDMKRRTRCPVQRVNADALHYTVLHEIQRAAKHRTVMHKLIAQSGGMREPNEAQKVLRGQLAKRKQFVAVQITNITRAIAEGGNFRTLLATLEQLEKEQDAICQELMIARLSNGNPCVVEMLHKTAGYAWRSQPNLYRVGKELGTTDLGRFCTERMIACLQGQNDAWDDSDDEGNQVTGLEPLEALGTLPALQELISSPREYLS